MSVRESLIESLVCLLVDDDQHQRAVLRAGLMAVGIKEILMASNGSEAFNILSSGKRPIDLVMSDIRLPTGNGLQLLHALRTGQIKGMRINATFILTTSTPTTESVKVASSLDANGYVVKPVVPEKLEAAILKARRTVFPAVPSRYASIPVPAADL
jgi:CheY-like chemotaxis protein